jgi:hypothetical protein
MSHILVCVYATRSLSEATSTFWAFHFLSFCCVCVILLGVLAYTQRLLKSLLRPSVGPSVRMKRRQDPTSVFSLNLLFQCFIKVYQHIKILVQIVSFHSPNLFYRLTVGVEVVYFHLITLRHTPQSVGLLWTRDRPVTETST